MCMYKTIFIKSTSFILASLVFLFVLNISAHAAIITVTTTTDAASSSNGQCTLREAVIAANTNAAVDGCTAGSPGADTINIPASGTAYTLTIAGAGENSSATGDLDILEAVTITKTGTGT